MTDQGVWEIAQQAAELLPEPPPAHDAFGYLAWEELVLETARRIQWRTELDGATDPVTTHDELRRLALAPRSARLDADALLTLARLLTHADDTMACEQLLSAAVATSREGRPSCQAPGSEHRRALHSDFVHRLRPAGAGLAPRV